MNNSSAYQVILDKLDAFIRKYYKNQILKGILYTASILLIFYLLAIVLEYFSRFSPAIKTGLVGTLAVVSGSIILYFIIIPLFKLLKLGKTLSYEQAAEIVGSHFLTIKDKLLNTLQLNQLALQKPANIALIEASIQQRTNELRPVPFTNAVDLNENKKYLKYLAIPLTIFFLLFLFYRQVITEGTSRLLQYNKEFLPPMPFSFQLENENLQTRSQQDFELNVVVKGTELPEIVYVKEGDAKFKTIKIDNNHFSYTFRNPTQDVGFQLWADGWSSDKYNLEVLPSPSLVDFEVNLSYPAYTGKKNEVVQNSGDLIVPIGTTATWKFKTQNTNDFSLVFSDSSQKTISPNTENNYSYTEKLVKNKKYMVAVANEHFQGRDSTKYAVTVIPDAYPSINIDEIRDSLNEQKIYFNGDVSDDYGFSRLAFHYTIINPDNPGRKVANSFNLNVDKAVIEAHFTYAIDIGSLPVQPGDEIDYYFEVTDNDGVFGAKSARSQQGTYHVKTVNELKEEVENDKEMMKNDMESTLKDLKKIQKEIDELNKKMLDKKELDYNDKKRLEELMKQEKQIQQQLQDIQKQSTDNQKEQKEMNKKENYEKSERILEKEKQIQDLFNKIMDEDMKKKYEELEKLMKEMDKNKLKEQLEKMKEENKDLEKELDRTLELYKQLEVEQQLDKVMQELDKLQEKQEKLAEESKKATTKPEEIKKQQDELNKKMDELKDDLDKLQEKNKELEKPFELEETKEEEEETKKDMEESSEDLEKKEKEKASKKQKKAAAGMAKMKDKLNKMKKDMEEEEGEDLEKLRNLLENVVQLSFDEERIMKQLKKIDINNPQYKEITKDQRRLRENAQMVEDSLFALSKRVVELQSIINTEIADINRNMDDALELLAERYLSQATGKQQFVMTHLNNLALLLSEIVQDKQQDQAESEQQMKGNGSCKKPGGNGKGGKKGKKKGNKPSQSLQSMQQMQDQLNKQLKDMKEGKGESKGGKGSEGKQGSEGLARMAAEQEKLRQELQKVMQEIEEGGQKPGGNLQKVADDMEKTATDIVNKNITNETLNRQQEIMTKLLEAENAQREKEQDEKREATESPIENKKSPSQFIEYNKLVQRQQEMLRTTPPAMREYYKKKVNKYFNSIK